MFKSQRHQQVFRRVISGLERLGYGKGLLLQQYSIHDWFLPDNPMRIVPAAAFGRRPPSYDTACIAVLLSGERTGPELVSAYRALGAPVALEVDDDRIVQWKVGKDASRIPKWDEFSPDALAHKLSERRTDWSPGNILRGKNVFAKLGPRQLDFIDLGLMPALEHHVREKLDRLLHEVLQAAVRAFKRRSRREPDMQELFRLVFRFIAAKVLCDRRVSGFCSISDSSDPDTILDRVGRYYKQSEPILSDRATRQAVADRIWDAVSFQNLSVEALAYVYENTLVDEELRRKLGTHSTPSSVARYVVSRLIDEHTISDTPQIVEPCSGHGIFLVAALERLRELLPSELDSDQRHRYFVRALRGFELDPFALEVSKLCLMLADFPFPNGWRLSPADVFASPAFSRSLAQADVVLCNPPFGDFSTKERKKYPQRRAVQKPAELLHRVLDKLKPSGTLGFVLPRQFLDGAGYRDIREQLACRFRKVEIVALPDRVFRVSQLETALLIAKEPVEANRTVAVSFAEVSDADRHQFMSDYAFTRTDYEQKSSSDFAASAHVLLLRAIWDELSELPVLGDVAELRRGVQWQSPFREEKYISTEERRGFARGLFKIPNRYFSFQTPSTVYLSTKPEHRYRNAFDLPWQKPKVIMNAATVSRGLWRVAAFPDREGILCSANFQCLWPRSNWSVECLSAVLNGPIANAYLTANEDKIHLRKGSIVRIPLPRLSPQQMLCVDELVGQYNTCAERIVHNCEEWGDLGRLEELARDLLIQIDAVVLKAYSLPPRVERVLLDAFRNEKRRVPFDFGEYFSEDFGPTIPLWMYISDDFKRCNAEFLQQRAPRVTDPVLINALAEVE